MTVVQIGIGVLLLLGLLTGVWRGALREGITFTAILLGALLAEGWGPLWSRFVSQQTGLALPITQWLIGLGLLAITLLIGYGSGLLLPYRHLRPVDRIAGALLGLLNVGLLTAFVLRSIQRWFFGEATFQRPVASWIRQDMLSRFLVVWVGEILLGVALLGAAVVLLAALVRLLRNLRRPAPVVPPAAPSPTSPTASTAAQPTAAIFSDEARSDTERTPAQPNRQPPIGQQEKFLDYPPPKKQE